MQFRKKSAYIYEALIGGRMEKEKIDSLMEKVASGDTLYLKEIYEEYKDHLFRYILSIVKNVHVSEDIMQETFLNVAKYANTYKLNTNFKAWLFKIAHNLINRYFLDEENKCLDIDDLIEQINDESYDISSSDIGTLKALSKLEESERKIVILFVYEEFTQPQIAKILNLPYITVRSKYANAVKKLKHYYRKENPDEKE